jgi:hypothetical protein
MSRCLFLSFLLLLAACSGIVTSVPTALGPTVTNNPNALPTLTPFEPAEEPASTQSIATRAGQPALTSVVPTPSVQPPAHYTLEAVLDYAAHSLSADETITYRNPAEVDLDSLLLAVEPNWWKGCFSLGDLLVNGQPVEDAGLAGDRFEIPLPSALAPADSVNLVLHFDLTLPPADVHHLFGYNEFQANLVDWYPFIVPYQDGWILHTPANVGEHLVYDEAAFDVTLSLADPAPAVTFAAGAPAESSGGTWHYYLSSARTFAFSASPAYQTASTTVNGLPVVGNFFVTETLPALAALDEVAKAVSTFSALFGPYPYQSLSMVESPYFDGMEYDGLFFISRDYYIASDGTVLNNLVDIAVHETAHQWWFGSVGNDQALEPWLDEALATYSERLFYEQNYPQVTAWQEFRVDSFSPSGWVDTDIYHGQNFRTYANAVYLRGAQFLQAIRERMGDPAFFAFLKDYASTMAGKHATSADFFWTLRLHTTADLGDLISSYFQNPH